MAVVKTVLRVVVIAMLLLQSAMAKGKGKGKNYVVGGQPLGWIPGGKDIQAWANSHKFFVGDSLTFECREGDSVVQVLKRGFDACDASNPIFSSDDALTVVNLTSPGVFYFIGWMPEECLDGMKVAITVLLPSPSPSPTSTA